MDRKAFLHNLAIGMVVAPSLACARAAGSSNADEIEITVHKDPG
jgi:hypothetical protein